MKRIPHYNLNFPSSKSSSHHPIFQTKWDTGFNQGEKNTNKGPWMQLKWKVLLSLVFYNTTGCDPPLLLSSPPPLLPITNRKRIQADRKWMSSAQQLFMETRKSKSNSIWTDWPELKVNIISENTLACRVNTAERSEKEEGGVGSDGRAGGDLILVYLAFAVCHLTKGLSFPPVSAVLFTITLWVFISRQKVSDHCLELLRLQTQT